MWVTVHLTQGDPEQVPEDWVSFTDHGIRLDYPNAAGHTMIPWWNITRADYIPEPTKEDASWGS